MVLQIYNTLTNKKEIFKPVKEGEVKMYVCGPTVNDVPHLGHARMQIVFDVVRKYLEFSNYKVNFVSNVTDIEDKIIAKAKELGISTEELSKKNLKEHKEDYSTLGVKSPSLQPKATEHVKEMIELIKNLEKKGYTYKIEEDGVYYNVSKFKDYGKLSNVNLKELKKQRELKDESKGQEKKDPKDFVLWKFSKAGEPSWKSPWGAGRPGWHIECSAMTHSILGLPLDIHAGGQDLIFPHHEDEIAQSEAGYGEKFSNYWMHNGMVNVDRIKMSKSLGNFKTIKDILKNYSGEVVRYFVLNTHYRKPIDFSLEKLNESKTSLERLKNLISEVIDDNLTNHEFIKEFEEVMDDDFNTAEAINLVWSFVKDKEAIGKIKTIKKIDKVFGLNLLKKEKIKIPKKIQDLLKEREIAREEKNFTQADRLREKIKELGFEVKDTLNGQVLKKL